MDDDRMTEMLVWLAQELRHRRDVEVSRRDTDPEYLEPEDEEFDWASDDWAIQPFSWEQLERHLDAAGKEVALFQRQGATSADDYAGVIAALLNAAGPLLVFLWRTGKERDFFTSMHQHLTASGIAARLPDKRRPPAYGKLLRMLRRLEKTGDERTRSEIRALYDGGK